MRNKGGGVDFCDIKGASEGGSNRWCIWYTISNWMLYGESKNMTCPPQSKRKNMQ